MSAQGTASEWKKSCVPGWFLSPWILGVLVTPGFRVWPPHSCSWVCQSTWESGFLWVLWDWVWSWSPMSAQGTGADCKAQVSLLKKVLKTRFLGIF